MPRPAATTTTSTSAKASFRQSNRSLSHTPSALVGNRALQPNTERATAVTSMRKPSGTSSETIGGRQ